MGYEFVLEKGFLHESKDYGEMVTGATRLGFVSHQTAGSHGFRYNRISAQSEAPGIEVGLVTSDVETAFEKAVRAGATPVSRPAKKPWGQVVSYIRDCNGLLVEICSEV